MRRFVAGVAQSEVQRFCKALIAGSSPAASSSTPVAASVTLLLKGIRHNFGVAGLQSQQRAPGGGQSHVGVQG